MVGAWRCWHADWYSAAPVTADALLNRPPNRTPPLPSPHPATGLLSLPQEDMHPQENPGVQQRWADDFRKQFEPFDWTKMLE